MVTKDLYIAKSNGHFSVSVFPNISASFNELVSPSSEILPSITSRTPHAPQLPPFLSHNDATTSSWSKWGSSPGLCPWTCSLISLIPGWLYLFLWFYIYKLTTPEFISMLNFSFNLRLAYPMVSLTSPFGCIIDISNLTCLKHHSWFRPTSPPLKPGANEYTQLVPFLVFKSSINGSMILSVAQTQNLESSLTPFFLYIWHSTH